jgi:hypothetical protein
MKHKHGREGPLIKVISDPKKLAWLKAEIEKRKPRAVQRVILKGSEPYSE